ncbi:MAG: response regulator receiver protein [Gammaproteobacteria bacterium]|nr:response regulator receiver protein [Gammaproteobacteria bacterium]
MGGSGSLISIVDDDDSVRRALRNLFVSLGFSVEAYASAEAFLLSHRREDTSCLILDLRMSGMSGLDLLHSRTSARRIPTVILTGHPSDDARARCMQAGAVAFLQKPFDTQALLDVVTKTLNCVP